MAKRFEVTPHYVDPWVELLSGWRLIAAWALAIIGPWVLLYVLGRIVFALIEAWSL